MSGSPRLIGLPYDASSSFLQGAAEAPPLIRAALHSPAWNSLGPRPPRRARPRRPDRRRRPGPAAAPRGAGVDRGRHRRCDRRRRSRPIALGGDHSVTYPTVRAVAQSHAPLTILHIDAHPDLYDVFEGDRYSHACPFARIMEEGLASAAGAGGHPDHEPAPARAGRPLRRRGDRHAGLARRLRPRTSGKVYLSIDLDGLDPAYAPGVSHHEPGGLSTRGGAGTGAGAGRQSSRGGRRRVQPGPRRRRRHGHGGREDREGDRGADDGGGRLTSASRLTA